MNNLPTISPSSAEAIIRGYERNAFAVLGPQPLEHGGMAVRVFEPGATAVELITADGTAQPMNAIYYPGLFEVLVDAVDRDYTLRITYGNDVVVERRDVYSFQSTLSELDRYLLGEGTDLQMYDKLGAHLMEIDGVAGTRFTVWAPNAQRVSVVGDFNLWDGRRHAMRFHPGSGIWEIFIPGIEQGTVYKYEIKARHADYTVLKTDPVGFYNELRPNNASVVWNIDDYEWNDEEFLERRTLYNSFEAPISIYEVHLQSWRRSPNNEWLSYRDLADQLVSYVKYMGFTHIELLPPFEHPFDGSWGYQVTGYFAPTSRLGTPQDFMYFVDKCHQAGIGVIVDWVPAHFPKDQHSLGLFDGTHLYEHADPRQGQHPDWGTYIFNFGRNEVRQFLLSNALFWCDKYHIDGLRVDAVASMLYLDFSREPGQWVPNVYGGRENIEAITFLRHFNDTMHRYYPDVITFAEESTDWAGVTAPTRDGGLGFDMKWNMGWMHDSLQYMSTDPIFRPYHHGTMTFSLLYAFSERFVLPYSHDEVVHLKKSMVDKMPGDAWQKFANLRTLYGYMFSHPGKKLLFMGDEFGQWREWTEEYSLDWHLAHENSLHGQLQLWVRDLNHLYQQNPALYQNDSSWHGFEWLEVHDAAHSIFAYARKAVDDAPTIIVACNFTPVVRHGYRLAAPIGGVFKEVLNSDHPRYGGSGVTNDFLIASEEGQWRGQPYSIQLTLPPLGVTILRLVDEAAEEGSD